jgi:hypothetical protein
MMHPYLEQARTILEEAVNGMRDDEMTAKRAGKWSPAEIVEHLALAFGATAAGMQHRLRTGEVECRRATMKDRVATLMVVTFGYIPTGREAPAYTVPSGVSAENALRSMRENLAQMDAAIAEMEQRFGDRVIGMHPVIGPLNANQWRKFHMVHSRHHARQIAMIKAEAGRQKMTNAVA